MEERTDKEKATELKQKGNDATRFGDHSTAVVFYRQAIKLDPDNYILYSNRSAAQAKLKWYSKALADAEKVIELRPDWAKGYGRKGLALTYLDRHDEAIQTYQKGLQLEPENASLKQGLQEAQAAKLTIGEDGTAAFNPFADFASVKAKLRSDPRNKYLLDDVEVMDKLEKMQARPSLLSEYIQDPGVMTALTAVLGINPAMAEPYDPKEETPRPQPMEEDLPPDEEEALKQKVLGNAAYKNRNFETAVGHYQKAIELQPSNITYLLNLAAVRLEQSQLQTCIELCLKAVELGREQHADFKLIARALSRCALAYQRMEDYEQAKNYYEKSLSEHRNPDTRTKLSEVEKKLKAKDEAAYLDPEKAEEDRERGNALFKEQKFSEAVKAYTEAIRRDPKNCKTYSNRAACYTKLAAFDLGVKDCNMCISVDPTFVKGYVRKGTLYKAMRQFDKAMEAFQKAIDLDENNMEAIKGYRECMTSVDDYPDHIKKRALSDPEIQKILSDPGMRIILDQMQDDPEAAREHLRNPDIAAKIQKLVQSGLVAFH